MIIALQRWLALLRQNNERYPLQICKHGSKSVLNHVQQLLVAISSSWCSTQRLDEIVDPPAVRDEIFLIDDDGFGVSSFVDMLVGIFWLFEFLFHWVGERNSQWESRKPALISWKSLAVVTPPLNATNKQITTDELLVYCSLVLLSNIWTDSYHRVTVNRQYLKIRWILTEVLNAAF